MNEDEKMFRISMVLFILVMAMTFTLQLVYRIQNKELARVRNQIVETQQEIAIAQASFSASTRPEILRNLVMNTSPKAEVISFHKSVEIADLPDRLQK